MRINGTVVHEQEGMFTPFDIDLTEYLNDENTLDIIIFPAPRHPEQPDELQAGSLRHLAIDSCKPACAYGWDWHPVLIPLGIWDKLTLSVRPQQRILDSRLEQYWDEDAPGVAITVHTALQTGSLEWIVRDPSGEIVAELHEDLQDDLISFGAELIDPPLWWPRGYGDQPLFTSECFLRDVNGTVIDHLTHHFGVRRITLDMHPQAWDEPTEFPKSRSTPPMTVTVNGQPIFIKGSNWVPPDVFPGRITAETYRELITLACEANFNTLRVWGGGIVNKDAFYELCDQHGLLVFCEFPLACNPYSDDAHYLNILEREAISIVCRYQHHASIALWSGGNELFNGWSGMTDQSLPLRLLNSICFQLDPQRPFLPTFPVMGMGHGPYTFLDGDSKEEVISLLQRSNNTAYSEFGSPGPSPADYLRKIIPTDELFPPQAGTSWETHHAFHAWTPDTWLCWNDICTIYGEPQSLEELCQRGAELQAIGYQAIFEEARRQWPRCSMAINWCFNEPWPSAANNSIINYPAEPKPEAFAAVRDACRDQLLCAQIKQLRWQANDIIDVPLELINDSQASHPSRHRNGLRSVRRPNNMHRQLGYAGSSRFCSRTRPESTLDYS